MKVSEENTRLYHYTTWDGLVGILKNQSLWATHHRFLNDYSETLLIKDKLIELVRPIIREESRNSLDDDPDSQFMQYINNHDGFDAFVNHQSNIVVTGMYKTLPHDGLFITSFCEESKDPYIIANGALSQWRGYGQNGGFALVLDTQRLECMLKEEFKRYDYPYGLLADVVYSDDEERFKSEFTHQLSRMRKFIRAMIKCFPDGVLDPVVQNDTKALPALVSCISRYKHQGFKEENEVRICAYPAVHSEEYLNSARAGKVQLKPEKKRKFRERNGEYIPSYRTI